MKNQDKQIKELEAQGFCTFKNYFSKNTITKMEGEFDKIIKQYQHEAKSKNGVIKSIKLKELEAEGYSALPEAMCDGRLISVVNGFYEKVYDSKFTVEPFDKVDLEFNDEVGKSINSGLHYDRIPSLKCQIYLNDVAINNGAMVVLPKSQADARQIALAMLEKNPNPLYLKNFWKKEPQKLAVLSGSSGTPTIFDTMVLHKGGEIKTGKRKTLRMVKWPPKLNKQYYMFGVKKNSKFQADDFYHPKSAENKNQVNPRFLYSDL